MDIAERVKTAVTPNKYCFNQCHLGFQIIQENGSGKSVVVCSGKSVVVCILSNFELDCSYLTPGSVLPKVTLSEVASLLSQNPTQLSTTIRAQGRYTYNIIFSYHRGRIGKEIPGSESTQCVFVTETQLEELRKFQLKVRKF